MTGKLTKENILSNRYELFAECGRSAQRLDKSEVWFFQGEDCRSILRSSTFTAKRSGASSKVREFGCTALAKFFDEWLMFRDDEFHRTVKPIVGKWLSALAAKFEGCTIPHLDLSGRFDVVSEFALPFTMESFARFFGVEKTTFDAVVNYTDLGISILGDEEVNQETAHAANDAIIIAKNLVSRLAETHESVRQIYTSLVNVVDRDSAENILLNVAADGVHPTIAALGSELLLQMPQLHTIGPLHAIESRDSPRDSFFYQEAPFQYIARIAEADQIVGGVDVQKGGRVVACIAQCARSGDAGLVFGAGRHSCPGSQIALRIVADGCRAFRELVGSSSLTLLSTDWQKSIGYRALTSFVVAVEGDRVR